MDVRGERETERPKRARPGCTQRGWTGRAPHSIVLVPNLRRGHGGTGHPGRQPPQAHVVAISRPGERTGNDANGDIGYRRENHRTDRRATRHDVTQPGGKTARLGGLAIWAASASICRPRSRAQLGNRIAPFRIIPTPAARRNTIPDIASPTWPLTVVAIATVAVTPRAANPAPLDARAAPCTVRNRSRYPVSVGPSGTCKFPLVHCRIHPSERVVPRASNALRNSATTCSHSRYVIRRFRF